MFKLRPYQEKAKAEIFQAWNAGYKNALLRMPTGSGKCLGENTPVLMYDGSVKPVQDIKKSDLLMGPDSKPKKVLSTCAGESDLYRINPVKGDSWVCNDIHVLSLRHTTSKKIIDIPLNEYLKKSNNFKHHHKQFRTGVEFKEQPTFIDPWFLGIFLAEGSHGYNCITTPEPEVKEYLQALCDISEHKMRAKQGNNCEMLHVSSKSKKWRANWLKKVRTSCTTRDSRWIPKEYLINSRQKRLQLLAGILDGDGYFDNGVYDFITKYKQLSDDVLFLCRSLGFAAYGKKVKKRIKKLGFEGDYYRISISGKLDELPMKVPRKKALPRRQKKDVTQTGFTVESIGKGKYYGFTLDGDGRFLLGDFTVTHNTVTFASLVLDTMETFPTAIIVHRKELVQQICTTLASQGIQHNIIASRKDIRGIIAAERRLFGKQFYNVYSKVTVISVDTLLARKENYKTWAKGIRQWVVDEATHVLKENKWGKALELFENCRGLGVTATPERLDRKGLGSHVDGVFDVMVEGPTTSWLIQQGYLSKYKIAVPPSDYEQHLESKSDKSDYSKKAMMQASKKSKIVGDVVENYIKFANGKQAILFATDVATSNEMVKKFNDRGIPAKSLDGTTLESERLDTMIKFRDKELQVLSNVDLFDEGLDVPGIECVIMGRPTKSLGKFLQMVGRGLRTAEGKPYLILIDHVGNVKKLGLPCDDRKWTLDRISKRAEKLNFLRICQNIECNAPYDRALTECPWCGHEAITQTRDSDSEGTRQKLEQVDGDLELLDPETIRQLESRVQLEDPGSVADRVGKAVNGAAALRAMKNQQERIATQRELVEAVARWAGVMKTHRGYTDRMIHKKFYLYHHKTITEALGEPKAEMEQTKESLDNWRDYL